MTTTSEQQEALDEFPASRPGPISLTALGVLLVVILIADNLSLVKSALGMQ